MKGLTVFLLATILAITVPVTFPQGGSSQAAVVEKGTRLVLQLNDHLSSKLTREGDVFTATVVSPVLLKDRLVIPKGSLVTGRVSRVQRPGRFRGKAMMNLIFETVRIPGKEPLAIVASLTRIDPEGKTATGSEGAVTGEGSAGKDAAGVAKPGLAGAGIGALIGGGKGAAIGAGAGAVAGLATVFATRGKDLEIRRGSTMEVVLDRPLELPPAP
ncbi:MAG: hypothetical protein FJW35_14815 [Acidobacteria bacterium]|nr:hypothetical protein [Acidobacteriota bacterium]